MRDLPQRLSREEADALLAVPSRRYPTGIRNRALLRLMRRTGIRCAEALALAPRDLQQRRNEIRVNQGKGGKTRILYGDPTTWEWLDRWAAARPAGPTFFNTLDGAPMLDSYVRAMVARYGRRARIEIRCHPHLLRHTFACEYLEDGGALHALQKLMGHARLETTAVYLHVIDSDLSRFSAERPG